MQNRWMHPNAPPGCSPPGFNPDGCKPPNTPPSRCTPTPGCTLLWMHPPPRRPTTVNRRAVRILLLCILGNKFDNSLYIILPVIDLRIDAHVMQSKLTFWKPFASRMPVEHHLNPLLSTSVLVSVAVSNRALKFYIQRCIFVNLQAHRTVSFNLQLTFVGSYPF